MNYTRLDVYKYILVGLIVYSAIYIVGFIKKAKNNINNHATAEAYEPIDFGTYCVSGWCLRSEQFLSSDRKSSTFWTQIYCEYKCLRDQRLNQSKDSL